MLVQALTDTQAQTELLHYLDQQANAIALAAAVETEQTVFVTDRASLTQSHSYRFIGRVMDPQDTIRPIDLVVSVSSRTALDRVVRTQLGEKWQLLEAVATCDRF